MVRGEGGGGGRGGRGGQAKEHTKTTSSSSLPSSLSTFREAFSLSSLSSSSFLFLLLNTRDASTNVYLRIQGRRVRERERTERERERDVRALRLQLVPDRRAALHLQLHVLQADQPVRPDAAHRVRMMWSLSDETSLLRGTQSGTPPPPIGARRRPFSLELTRKQSASPTPKKLKHNTDAASAGCSGRRPG
jgi:hypothetical protein